MQQYLDLVKTVLTEGKYKSNRTGVGTLSIFADTRKYDLENGFPILTTKDVGKGRWNSVVREFLWYLTGENHIRNLTKHTKIWGAWADEKGNLETAYGRFWRRFPIPEQGLEGEAWADGNCPWVKRESEGLVLDQVKYVIDTLKEDPNSRRMVVNAWHPGNATVSKLPPCHYTFVVDVLDGKVNVHMTQRSADIALGVPFNIIHQGFWVVLFAREAGLKPGIFAHTLIDAHEYCGDGKRGEFYRIHIDQLREKVLDVKEEGDYLEIRNWILREAPTEGDIIDNIKTGHIPGFDHIPGLLEQLSREPRPLPKLTIADKPLDELVFDDFKLEGYNPHPGIKFGIAV
ncbi:MAG TPA: thymidylate synthase [Candidatus Nanoarchaeia archaeon]|nr:thymidylate synthase [Candidatus Nanoarchaeia archaeon]